MAIVPDFAKPTFNNPLDTDLDAIRDNYQFLLAAAATAVSFSDELDKSGPVIPGWQTSVDTSSTGNQALPDGYVLTRGTRTLTINLTYSGSPAELATIQICYNDGVTGEYCFDAVSLIPAAILWDTTPITLFYITETTHARPELEFRTEADDSLGNSVGRYSYVYMPGGGNEWRAFVETFEGDYGAGEYVVKYAISSRPSGGNDILVNGSPGSEAIWYDADSLTIGLDDTVSSPELLEHVILDVTVARDDGLGNPIFGTGVTKQVTIIAQKAGYTFQVQDTFTDTNGIDLTAHSPDVGGTWVAHAGSFTTQALRVVSGGDARYVIDAGVADAAISAELRFNSQDAGLIGRAQDASNYWELLVEDADTADPVLKLNEVVSGTPTTVDSVTMTGMGPIDTIFDRYLRLMFDGNDIYGVCFIGDSLTVWTVTYTSTDFNSETLFGIHSTSASTTWDNMQVSNTEIGLIT